MTGCKPNDENGGIGGLIPDANEGPTLTSITISQAEGKEDLYIVKTLSSDLDLVATAKYSDNSTADVTDSVTWKSSNPSILDLESNGNYIGLDYGTSTITASYGGEKSANGIEVDVTPAYITWGDGAAINAYTSDELIDVVDVFINIKNSIAGLKKDGTVVTWGNTATGGDSSSVQSQLINVKTIRYTDKAFAAITTSGTVVTWGDSVYGGDSSFVQNELTNVVDIYANGFAFAALKADGTVVTWGRAEYGGDSSSVAADLVNITSISGGAFSFAALKSDGTVVSWGNSTTVSTQPAGLSGVIQLASTNTAVAALKSDGSVVAWGNASGGGDTSGVASDLTNVKSIQGNTLVFAAIKNDGKVVTWGTGTTASSTVTTYSDVYDQFKDVQKVVISPMAKSFAALNSDGTVVSWGYKYSGGDSSSVAADLKDVVDITTTTDSNSHFGALKSNGELVAWGNIEKTYIPEVASIYGNKDQIVALKTDGTVKQVGPEFFFSSIVEAQPLLTHVTKIFTHPESSVFVATTLDQSSSEEN